MKKERFEKRRGKPCLDKLVPKQFCDSGRIRFKEIQIRKRTPQNLGNFNIIYLPVITNSPVGPYIRSFIRLELSSR